MSVNEQQFALAQKLLDSKRKQGHAVAAHYDPASSRIIVRLASGIELTFPSSLMEGLARASAEDLAEIEITAAGLGLHWPKLDADVYIPGLLKGIFGSRRWMAVQLGAAGGRVRSQTMAAASRANGRKGRRPPAGANV